jgi:hypothetical protein
VNSESSSDEIAAVEPCLSTTRILPSPEETQINSMESFLSEYYRIPSDLRICLVHDAQSNGASGFFRFGSEGICYGRCSSGPTAQSASSNLHDALSHATVENQCVRLPFEPAEIIDNLRKERYARPNGRSITGNAWVRKAYYGLRNLLPPGARRRFQRIYLKGWREIPFPKWPVDFSVDTMHERLLWLAMDAVGVERVPFIWFWPDGASSCLMMTHDVETISGVEFTPKLMDMDDAHGIKASFQVVPVGRYEIPDDFIPHIRSRGFEVNVHDLRHDGSLFQDHARFLLQVDKINEHLRNFQSQGFRSGAMYRNQDWFQAFDISYDMSVPNVAHLEPQRGGCCTVMPYHIGKILELPLTMTQDYSLFHMLQDYSIDLWKTESNLILQRNGLISFIAHPDYLIESRARGVYLELLAYLSGWIAKNKVWHSLPGNVNRWWRNRSQMQLVKAGDGWRIEGPDKDRARIAYAVKEGDKIVYRLNEAS